MNSNYITADDLVRFLLSLKVDLTTIPILYIETVNKKQYLSQATGDTVSFIKNIGTIEDIELNTLSDVGVIIGNLPEID